MDTFESKYLTDEQIARVRDELNEEGQWENLEDVIKLIKSFLVENNTYDEKIKRIYSLLSSLKRLTKDDNLMRNNFLAPGMMYFPFVVLGLLVEVGVYDADHIRVESKRAFGSSFPFGENHNNEA